MKTLIIFNDIETSLEFLVIEGDFSRFHGVLVNSTKGTGFEDEFCDWMWDPKTGKRNNLGEWSEDVSVLESKDWDKVAICAFLP
jgi:hypothetical protein